MIGKDRGNALVPLADKACQHRGGKGGVGMNQIKIFISQLFDRSGGKRVTSTVPDQLLQWHGAVTVDFKIIVVGYIGIFGSDHTALVGSFRNDSCIIDNAIGNTVNGRRKGIVKQTDIQFHR